jgi:hypothetical protein
MPFSGFKEEVGSATGHTALQKTNVPANFAAVNRPRA